MTNTAAVETLHRQITSRGLLLSRADDDARAQDLLGELIAVIAPAHGIDPAHITIDRTVNGATGGWLISAPGGGQLALDVVDPHGDDQEEATWVRIVITRDDTTWDPIGRMQCEPINLPLWLGLALTAARQAA